MTWHGVEVVMCCISWTYIKLANTDYQFNGISKVLCDVASSTHAMKRTVHLWWVHAYFLIISPYNLCFGFCLYFLINTSFTKKASTGGGWCCGVVGKATVCNTCMPSGHGFVIWLFHFWTQCSDPCHPHGRRRWSSWLLAADWPNSVVFIWEVN